MKMNLTGKLLIAPPNVRGNFWSKTVIFVTEDHDQGSVGLVLNRQSKMTIKEFASQCGYDVDVPEQVHIGGPVNTRALTVLHDSKWRCDNTLRINKHFSVSSSKDILNRIAMGSGPNYWRLFVGLCTWAPGQLENEFKGNHPYNHDFSWLVATPDYNMVFDLDHQDQWTQAIEQSGMEFVQSVLA